MLHLSSTQEALSPLGDRPAIATKHQLGESHTDSTPRPLKKKNRKTTCREQEAGTDGGARNGDPRGGGERSAGERNQGQQKVRPAARTAQPPQPKLSQAPATARSLPPSEDTPTTRDTRHGGSTANLDVDDAGEETVGQRGGEAGEHARSPSGTEEIDVGRQPSIPEMDIVPEDRVVPLAGQAVGGSERNAEEREGRREENGEGLTEGRGLVGRDGESLLHAESEEPQGMGQTDRNRNNGDERQPPAAAGEQHKRRTREPMPAEGEGEALGSEARRSAAETAGRRVGGLMAETGEERSRRSSGGEFGVDGGKAVGPVGPAEAWPKQRQHAEASEPPGPQETVGSGGHDVRSAGGQWGRDSGGVAIQERVAEEADGPSQGSELEFGNSGVWEHMEGEGVDGRWRTRRKPPGD